MASLHYPFIIRRWVLDLDDKLFYEPEKTIFLLFYFDQIGDILHLGWKEVNQETKNIVQRQVSRYEETGFIQKGGNFHEFLKISHIFDILFCFQLECCGWEGVKDFAGTSQPIDDSCYEKVTPTVSGIVARWEEQT